MLVTEPGAYLVRESSKNPGEYAVSVFHDDRVQHFIINSASGEFTFEDGTFGSIRELVDHHRAHRVPVTLLSGAILVSPVHKADTSNEPPPPIVSRAKKSSAPKPPEDLEDYEWFHGKLERADAKHLLRRVVAQMERSTGCRWKSAIAFATSRLMVR